jgi:hypothetical protein
MAVALFLLNRQRQRQRQQQIPRLFRDRTNPLDYMTDTQIVHNYRLDIGKAFMNYVMNLRLNLLDHKGNNKITELRTILQRESQNS